MRSRSWLEQPLRGNVILIVDDDSDSAAALQRLIVEAFGCRVLTASSGDEAIASSMPVCMLILYSQTWSCQKRTASHLVI